MSSICILGLYRADGKKFLEAQYDQIWSLNDWYRPYPTLKRPDRIFNLHFAPHVHESDEHRFPGDWRAEYLKAAQAGTKFTVVDEIEGVPTSSQEFLRTDLPGEVGLESLSCSISVMIYLAALEGAKEIHLLGVYLRDEEYRTQISGILKAIDFAESRRCRVYGTYIEDWKTTRKAQIPWAETVDVNVGTVKHIYAFYRAQVSADNISVTGESLS